MKACGCDGACSDRCRLDRYIARRAPEARQRLRQAASLPVNARPLKPSALAILGRLQKGPATNKELLGLAGFRYSSRVYELRRAGHVIRCEAGGPTRGVRWYTLEQAGRGGGGVGIEEPRAGIVDGMEVRP